MADQQQPSDEKNNGAGDMKPGSRAARTIADITRLFMTGAKPAPAEHERRRPPPAAENHAPGAAAAHGPAGAGNTSPSQESFLPAQLFVLPDQSTCTTADLLDLARAWCGSTGKAFGLLTLDMAGLHLHFIAPPQHSGPVDMGKITLSRAPDMQLARVLFAMRSHVQCWMIAAPAASMGLAHLVPAVRRCVTPCVPEKTALLNTFRAVRKLAADPAVAAKLQVALWVRTAEPALAEATCNRFRQVAGEFLHCPVTRLEVPPAPEKCRVRLIATFPIEIARWQQEVWAAVADFIHDISPGGATPESLPQHAPELPTADAAAAAFAAPAPAEYAAADEALPNAAAGQAMSLEDMQGVLEPAERQALAALEQMHQQTRGLLDDLAMVNPHAAEAAAAAQASLAPPAADMLLEAEEDAPGASSAVDLWPTPTIAVHTSHNGSAAPPDARNQPVADRPAPAPEAPAVAEREAPAAAPPQAAHAVASAATDPPPCAAPPAPAQPAVPQATAAETPAAATGTPPDCLLLVPGKVSSDDLEAQWAAVLQSIPYLAVRAAVIEAKPPDHRHACLAVDRNGALHVFLLATAIDPGHWGNLWQWTTEHRQLIALTCRDLHMAPDRPVSMHIVLPLAANCPPGFLQRPTLSGMTWYRIRNVVCQGQYALLVAPLG